MGLVAKILKIKLANLMHVSVNVGCFSQVHKSRRRNAGSRTWGPRVGSGMRRFFSPGYESEAFLGAGCDIQRQQLPDFWLSGGMRPGWDAARAEPFRDRGDWRGRDLRWGIWDW